MVSGCLGNQQKIQHRAVFDFGLSHWTSVVCVFLFFGHGSNVKRVTPLEFNIDTKNDGPWKMYLRLQMWRHFGYQVVKIHGGGTCI